MLGNTFGGGIGGSLAATSATMLTGVLAATATNSSLMGFGTLASIIPLWGQIGLGIAALMPTIISAIQGKNAYQAGAPEAQRDFNVSISTDQMKQIFDSLGLSESQAYPIRKDIESSPVVLQQMGALAQQQGTYQQFLQDISKIQTSWGTFDFSKAFQLGQTTGDWSELNKQFEAAFSNSQKLQSTMPDWKTKLEAVSTAASDAANNVDPLTQALTSFRDAIQGSITPVETMYDTFLKTGVITDELKQQIESLGGSIEDLQKLSDMNLQLTGMQQTLTFLDSLTSSIKGLAPQLDPINQLLSGQIGPELTAALTAAGLDPAKFADLAGEIGLEKNWSTIAKPFTAMTDQLKDALLKYGGTAGQQAVENYGQGFNTITQGLLDQTKAAMDQAYEGAVKDSLALIAQAQKETTDKMSALIEAINQTKSDIVTGLNAHPRGADGGDRVRRIRGDCRQGRRLVLGDHRIGSPAADLERLLRQRPGWQQQLQQILQCRAGRAGAGVGGHESDAQPPAADTGGLIFAHDGEAVLDREQTRNLLRNQRASRHDGFPRRDHRRCRRPRRSHVPGDAGIEAARRQPPQPGVMIALEWRIFQTMKILFLELRA